jgi:hypothetical protein
MTLFSKEEQLYIINELLWLVYNNKSKKTFLVTASERSYRESNFSFKKPILLLKNVLK